MLLAFDLIAMPAVSAVAALVDPINRLSLRGFDQPASSSLFHARGHGRRSTFPARLYFGPQHWFEFGPFSVQDGRVLLYATYFFIGAGIGAPNFDRGLLSAGRPAGEKQLGLDYR